MKKAFTLMKLLCLYACSFAQTISPAENTELCPHHSYANAALADPRVVQFSISFPQNGSYEIVTATGVPGAPVACKIVQNLPAGNISAGNVFIAFEDQSSKAATFSVRHTGTTAVLKTFSFAYIRSLKGMGPILDAQSPQTYPLCQTGSVLYRVLTNPRYRKADQHSVEFGPQVPLWEYSVPKGWTVQGQVSTGAGTWIVAPPGAEIRYDAFHSGNVLLKLSSQGSICDGFNTPPLSDGLELKFDVIRPVLRLVANGSATAVNITCGTSVTQTFALENAPASSCFTYRWDLGSDNNYWLYNGQPASRFISGTSSITLTSVACAGKPANVSLIVTATDGSSTTFTVPVTMQQPVISINGDERACLNTQYTVANQPCPGNVVWSIDNPANAQLTVNGDMAILKALQNGFVELTATISNTCGGGPMSVTRRITTGAVPTSLQGPFDPVTHNVVGAPCLGKTYYFQPFPITPGITYDWSVFPPDPNSGVIASRGTKVTVPFFEWGCYTVRLQQRGGCISPAISERVVCTQECTSGFSATLSPNPSKNILSITVSDASKAKEPVKIQLFDLNTGSKAKEWKYNNDQSKYQLNVSGLKRGSYVVTITKGQKQYSKQVVID